MTDGNNISNPAAPPVTVPGNPANPFRVYETKEQYDAAINRKLANYAPKTEYQAALDRASALEKSLGIVQAENAKLLNDIGTYKLGDLRKKVASDAQLPDEWADEIKGADEASMKEHAEALRKKLGIKQKAGNPVPAITPGPSDGQTENDVMNGFLIGMSRGVPLQGR